MYSRQGYISLTLHASHTSYTLHESLLWVYMCGSTSKLNVIFAMFSYRTPKRLFDFNTRSFCIATAVVACSLDVTLSHAHPHLCLNFSSILYLSTSTVGMSATMSEKNLIELPFTAIAKSMQICNQLCHTPTITWCDAELALQTALEAFGDFCDTPLG